MSEPTVTLFDIASGLEKQAWSPPTGRRGIRNAVHHRFSLNYKGIPFSTVWVEYPDIEPLCKKLGAAPTGTKPDGSPFYTLPVIQDHKTGVVLAESALIAEYLDKTYPSTPLLYPAKTAALQFAFIDAYIATLTPLWEFTLPKSNSILKPVSEKYFRSAREAWFGKKLEDVIPKGEDRIIKWGKVKDGFGVVDGWLKKSGGPFVMGDVISFADIIIVTYVLWLKKIFGENSDEWQDVKRWHGGRWDELMTLFEKYQGDAF